MRLPESMLLWTSMLSGKFHCDRAWLKSPFFCDKSFGWGSLLPLVLLILPTCFSPLKVFMYFRSPPQFLAFVDTDYSPPSFASFAPEQVKFSHSIKFAGSHGLNEPIKG